MHRELAILAPCPAGDGVVVVRLPPGRLAREAIVLRDEHGALRAFENLCQHVPIPLDAAGRKFLDEDGHLVCATHGALYRRTDGECISGPCFGRRLTPLRIRTTEDESVVEVVIDVKD